MFRQKSFDEKTATLYLVATPIGNLDEFTTRAISVLEEVDVIAAEDTRNTMKLLNHFHISKKLVAHHAHNEKDSAKGLLRYLEEGKDVAVVSDAGYPLISDPGYEAVRTVLAAGYSVVPISGANAAMNALVASGLRPQPYLFYGFLKSGTKEQCEELYALNAMPYTMIFYEAPHRITKTLQNCLEILGDRNMCLARELTKRHEEFLRGRISEVLEAAKECKGEMVIVMEGCLEKKEKAIDSAILNDQISRYLEEGLSAKDAIKRVAKEFGIAKNEVYKHYLNEWS